MRDDLGSTSMASKWNVLHLDMSQIETAADILARAFFDDPFATYLFPDADEREDLLFWYFGTMVQYGVLAGDVYMTAGCEGVAVLLPHNREKPGVDQLRQAGLLDAPDVLGPEPFDRLVRAVSHLEQIRRSEMPGSHRYLPTIGVDPSHQGRGVGGSLLLRACADADDGGVPCYLETFKESNTPLYQRYGFIRLAEATVPGTSLRYWTFRRDLHRQAAASPHDATERDTSSI